MDASESPGSHLTGRYLVRTTRAAWRDVGNWLLRRKDQARLWYLARGLRYWPEHHHETDSGASLNLDWSVIRGLEDLKIFELRIHETVGGMDNLRVIFHVGPPTTTSFPMPCIWLLAVFQKKRDDFGTHKMDIFRARQMHVRELFYGEHFS